MTLIAALNIPDTHLTLFLLENGIGEEKNPLAKLLIEEWPVEVIMFIKCVCLPLIVLIAVMQLQEYGDYMKYKIIGLIFTAGVAALYTFAVGIQLYAFIVMT